MDGPPSSASNIASVRRLMALPEGCASHSTGIPFRPWTDHLDPDLCVPDAHQEIRAFVRWRQLQTSFEQFVGEENLRELCQYRDSSPDTAFARVGIPGSRFEMPPTDSFKETRERDVR